ncbi:MAG: hypothetical protein Q9169_001325 [Polycauliona sp. 2 TL-2023]
MNTVLSLLLLAINPLFFFVFLPINIGATALPSSPHPKLDTTLSTTTTTSSNNSPLIVRRDGETSRYESNEDPKHRGTLHCFTTGTFETATLITSASRIRSVCGYDSSSATDSFSTFQYEPFANGSYPHQYVRIGSVLGKGYAYSSGEQVLWYDVQLQGAAHASYAECKWVMEKIVLEGGCPWGGNTGRASQGGWFQFEDDGTTYGVDPTFESVSGRSWSDGQ